MEIKTCKYCKRDYSKTKEYFYMSGKYFNPGCKSCEKKQNTNWAKNNPEKRKEILNRPHVRKNRLEKMKIYREQNWEKINQKKQEWKNNNLDKVRQINRKYRVTKRSVAHEPYTDQQVLDKYGHNCYLCQKPIDFTVARTEPKGFQVEHVIPISKNGPDTLENVRPSHAACNWSKGNKIIQGQVL
ncbi:MAG: HNH endonuclease [Thaumarchaeota archaeon]|nr:HNH endonuclease [Nitrososphaerota archaeon]